VKHKSVEDKLAVNKYDLDEEVHIRIKEETCQECEPKPCVVVCPADCFKLKEDHLTFAYEGCLECGSCRIVCPEDAIEWVLPRGGLGICYLYG
jgi:ferredoxin like protein